MTGCAAEGGRHYEVVSEPYTTYYSSWSYDPPETGCDWALVVARTAKEAIKIAATLPEFKTYVHNNRGDGMPPWKGIRAHRFECEHGNCWGCGECATCNEQARLADVC